MFFIITHTIQSGIELNNTYCKPFKICNVFQFIGSWNICKWL